MEGISDVQIGLTSWFSVVALLSFLPTTTVIVLLSREASNLLLWNSYSFRNVSLVCSICSGVRNQYDNNNTKQNSVRNFDLVRAQTEKPRAFSNSNFKFIVPTVKI